MDQKFKERAFGLAVLISVGVLVYPFLTAEKQKDHRLVLVPDMPVVAEDLSQPQPPVTMNQTASNHLSSEIERLQQEIDSLDAKGTAPGAEAPAQTAQQSASVSSPSSSVAPAQETVQVAALSQSALPVQKVAENAITKDEAKEAPFQIVDPKDGAPKTEEVKAEEPKAETKVEEPVKKEPAAPKATQNEGNPQPKLEKKTAKEKVKELKSPKKAEVAKTMAPPTKGWSVQMGSFSNPANAKEMEAKLKKGGYPAYTSTRVVNQTNLVKVMVGPKIKREDANSLKTKLESQFAVKALVVPYDPISG